MSKLLSRAIVKRENAENNYIKISLDDAYLDDCCYNLQQAIEYCLKYIIEIHGEKYIENHDIRAQLNKINESLIEIPEYNRIRNMATTLNSWNVESRYNDNFIALIDDVEDARKIAETLVDYCKSIAPRKINL